MIKPLKFCFKGNRNYVQGPDIVTELLKAMSERGLSHIDLKFNGITHTGLDLVEGHSANNAQVNIRWQEQSELKTYQLIENGEAIDCRYEYDEDKIIEKTQLDIENQSIHLKKETGYTLCENFVAINKFLLQNLYPEEQGKWYFTRLEQSRLVADESLIEVKLIKNFNFRLTKSDILLNGEVIGSVYFSMVKESA